MNNKKETNSIIYYLGSISSFILIALFSLFAKHEDKSIVIFCIVIFCIVILVSCLLYFIKQLLDRNQYNIYCKVIKIIKNNNNSVSLVLQIYNGSHYDISIDKDIIVKDSFEYKIYHHLSWTDKIFNFIEYSFTHLKDYKKKLFVELSYWQKRQIKKMLNPVEKSVSSLAKIMLIIGIIGLVGVHLLDFFGFSACDLCVKQRILSAILITLSFLSIIGSKINKKISKIGDFLITFCVLAMLGLAIFHVGVEYRIFELPDTCSKGIDANQSIEDMTKMLLSPESLKPSCGVPQILFGISVAVWSLLGVLVLFSITIWHWFIRKK